MSNFWKNKSISITGGNGFLGKHVRKKLEQRNCKKISIVDHKKYNLVDGRDVQRMYDDQKARHCFSSRGGGWWNRNKSKKSWKIFL